MSLPPSPPKSMIIRPYQVPTLRRCSLKRYQGEGVVLVDKETLEILAYIQPESLLAWSKVLVCASDRVLIIRKEKLEKSNLQDLLRELSRNG